MKQCSRCGAFMDDNAQFCTSCGTPYNPTSTNNSPSGKNYQMWYYIGGGVAAVAIAVLVWIFLYSNKAETVPSPAEASAPVSESFQNEINSVNATPIEESGGDTDPEENGNVEEKVIPLEHQMHYFLFCRNGLWGLRNDMKDVTEAIYVKAVERDGYVMFIRQDGLYEFYQFSNKIFSKPADKVDYEYDGQFECLVAHHGKEIMIFTPYRTHVIEKVKAYKKIDNMLLCRFEDDSFMFLSVTGLEYKDELKHPRRLICRSSDAELVVCEEPNGNQHVFKTDCRGFCVFTPEQWAVVERDYLESTNIEDPVFEKVYEHGPKMSYIYDQLR